MSEIDAVKTSLQSLANDVQALSASMKAASQNMQASSTQVMGASAGAVQSLRNLNAGAGTMFSRPISTHGFTGVPTSIQYSSGVGVPIIGGGRDNFFTSLGMAGNNEYNKNPNWFRDILALSGKEFIDVDSETARKRAARNWNLRGREMAMDAGGVGAFAIGTALGGPLAGIAASVAWDTMIKPTVMAKDRRQNAYYNWFEQTGYRNVTAKWSNQAEGGWTDNEKEQLKKIEIMHRGSGWKKSQFDEMMQSWEASGYFKTYDKTSVDQMADKIRKGLKEAEYIMKTLHTTAGEAAKIMGDVNQMSGGGSPGVTTRYVNNLNAASAYTGLSGMQLNEFAVGRSEYFKQNYNMSGTEAANSALQEIKDYYQSLPSGKRPDYGRAQSLQDQVVQKWRGSKEASIMSLAMYKWDEKEGKLVWDKEYNERIARGDVGYQEWYTKSKAVFDSMPEHMQIMAAKGGAISHMHISGLTGDVLNDYAANVGLQIDFLRDFGRDKMGGMSTWSEGEKQFYYSTKAGEYGFTPKEVENLMQDAGVNRVNIEDASKWQRLGIDEVEKQAYTRVRQKDAAGDERDRWKKVLDLRDYPMIHNTDVVTEKMIDAYSKSSLPNYYDPRFSNRSPEEHYQAIQGYYDKKRERFLSYGKDVNTRDKNAVLRWFEEAEEKNAKKEGAGDEWLKGRIVQRMNTYFSFDRTGSNEKTGFAIQEWERRHGQLRMMDNPFKPQGYELASQVAGIKISDTDIVGRTNLQNSIFNAMKAEYDLEQKALSGQGGDYQAGLAAWRGELKESLERAGMPQLYGGIAKKIEAGYATKDGYFMDIGRGKKENIADQMKALGTSQEDIVGALGEFTNEAETQAALNMRLAEYVGHSANALAALYQR